MSDESQKILRSVSQNPTHDCQNAERASTLESARQGEDFLSGLDVVANNQDHM